MGPNAPATRERVGHEELVALLKLRQPGIQYRSHEAVFTCEQADQLFDDLPGTKAKNLLLKDRKGNRYILLCAAESRRVDLKILASTLGSSRLSMATNEELERLLGTESGALSLLSLINDTQLRVEPILDAELAQIDLMLCHPLSNRCTMAVDMRLLLQMLDHSGHSARWIALN
ncbi:YbaK/EbsC family protein [Aestuariirhabdus sp. LZHN29]|uniref:YbaK/EbsC family protein n=1 Tax=Aestuariirhabdus sp. LZHN29 TaxID=3417462 RepID=UPI003CEA272A